MRPQSITHSVFPLVLAVYSIPVNGTPGDERILILRGRDTKAVFTWFDTLQFENIFNKEIKEGKDTGTFQRERDR